MIFQNLLKEFIVGILSLRDTCDSHIQSFHIPHLLFFNCNVYKFDSLLYFISIFTYSLTNSTKLSFVQLNYLASLYLARASSISSFSSKLPPIIYFNSHVLEVRFKLALFNFNNSPPSLLQI